jgi:SNF2 family DNA or RNA helicase
MEKFQGKDPFLWDVENVVQNICAPGCPWTRNAAALANKVREEEIDGKTLLTYEHLCSRQELMECLGIKVARHKAALSEAIHDIRYASLSYQSWLKAYKKKEEGPGDETNGIVATTQNLPLPQESAQSNGNTQDLQVNGLSTIHEDHMTGVVSHGGIHDVGMASTVTTLQILQPESSPGVSNLETSTQLGETASFPTNPAPSPPNLSSDHQLQSSNDEDRLTKRRRIAPLNLTSKPLNKSVVPIPTEADAVTGLNDPPLHEGLKTDFPWEESAPHAYLGNGSLSVTTIKSSSGSISSQLIRIDEDQFTISADKTIPPGRRLAVYHAMKQHFKENSRKEVLLNQGLAVQSVRSSEDSDPVLDLSDLPDEFDEQTLREIEAERVDMERSERLQLERFLTRERVKIILDETVASFSSTWESVKLPKYQRRAYKIWHGAARHGTRKIQILKARREAELYDQRIKKLYAGIMDEKWGREAEVRLQARSLEQSVEDKLYRLWLLELLESRAEPPRPSVIARTAMPTVPRPTTPLSGEELLSSDEEEEFIVPDSPPGDVAAYDDALLDNDPKPRGQSFSSPVKPSLSVHVDLTQFTPVKTSTAHRERIEIDLTSPIKPSPQSNSPSAGFPHQTIRMKSFDLEEELRAEECGAQTGSHWAKEQKRWHLVLCLLWRLTQARRSPILQLIQDNSPADVWKATVQRHLEAPAKESELGDVSAAAATRAFDLTRIFFSFIRVKNCKESRIANLRDRYQTQLNAERDTSFPQFCGFISGMAWQFPADNQIYRSNALDDDLAEADDVFDDDTPARSQNTPSKPRKTLVKEIVQNKEALDMREREMRRTEEQKARRATLRAKLAMSDAMPHDKSRLIINESKQEDQEFIYVNDEIGKRIKDHQIDGVRFLWNQIVLDPEFRQGCLLAHTMGLGKTMQVITLLVAIAEAVISPDPSTQEQIPECLRESKTLILCPAGLVDNWMDEILIWAPAGLLGDLRKIDSTMLEYSERFSVVKDWAQRGGVLIMGYPMFQKVSSADDEIQSILTDTPNIVVADEAHYLKAPDAKVTRACSQFQTMSRIALTGSPLANNVEEYHSMIDWVAPNFLGPLSEFREIYANPIQQGLWTDSLGYEKRKALKMLQVLKETVAPKVHRATIKSCLKNDLPPKYEFVISVAATDIQKRLYKHYIEQVKQVGGNKIPQAQLFGIVHDLTLICNHPRCFREKVTDLQKSTHPDKPVPSFPMAAIPAFLRETNVPDLINASLSMKVELLIKILNEARDIGDKVLVFSQSTLTMDYLMYVFQQQKRRVQRLDGKTPIGHRQDMVKDFNTGSHDVYVISTKAGGVGLNIQGANRVVIFDFKWNPVSDQQAIGRAYRIGQQKTVFVYRFIVGGTFEEDLQNKAVFKMQLASRVVDKKNPVSWSKRLGSLIHPIEERDVEDLSEFTGKDKILDTLISTQKPGSIRSIVSTDTFEEEDPAVDLTTEERREADNLINMNRLRITDPQEYMRLKEQEQREEAARLRHYIPSSAPQYLQGQAVPTAATVPPSTQQAGSRYGLDGAYDAPDWPNTQSVTRTEGFSVYPHPMTMTPREDVSTPASITAPLPMMAGANTFFRQKSPPPTQVQERREAPQSGPSKPLSAFGGVFGNPREAARVDFEKRLVAKLYTLREKLTSTISGSLESYATNIATSIDDIRKERAFGFLPDSQHWKLLTEFLSSDRLVHATCVGVVTISFLALTDRAELERRVETLDKLTDSDFQLPRRDNIGQPEPHVCIHFL